MTEYIKIREVSYGQDLNDENKLFVRFIASEDFKYIEEFVVSLISIINNKKVEIIRFDCTKKENVNVHRFYNKPPTKHYFDKEKSFETIEEFIQNIKEKWAYYRLRYAENYG